MAADASSTLARGKILLKAQEVTFAKALAGNNLVLRDRAIRRLKKWFDARSKGKFCFEEDDLMRVWKGLYHCMWMSDKPLVQEALSEEIAALVHSFATPEQMTLFVRCFYLTMILEWVGIDQLRLDKYLMLIRRVLRQSLVALRRREWAQSALELYNTATASTLLTPRELVPIGLVTHYCSIFLEELAKIGGAELAGPVVSMLMPPMVALWAESRSMEVRRTVMRSVLDPLIAQSPITLREDARFRAWAKAGFPGSSMYSMELVEDEDEEVANGEEPTEGTESAQREEPFDGLDPRAGSADVALQPISFDAGLVAEIFDKHLKNSVGKAHVSISRQQRKFARLAKGLDPITRRHRVRDLRALPLVRKEEKWRCARQWQSAVELAEFDPAQWKESKKRKNKFKGETDDEIFADFVSKHATGKKKQGASGKFTVVNGDLTNGDIVNGEASDEIAYEGRAKKPKLSGQWTVTTENGVDDGESSQETQRQGTPASKLGKRKALQMANKQSIQEDSSKKQTPAKSAKKEITPVESAKKTLLVESAKKTPVVASAKKTSAVESVSETLIEESAKKTPLLEKKQTPLVKSTKKTPLLEKKQTPLVESSKKTPKAESVKKTQLIESTKKTPLIESVKNTPIVESTKKTPVVESIEKTPKVESTKKTPIVESMKKTPKVESTKKTPKVESTKKTPIVESTASSTLAVESSDPATTPARSPDGGRRKLFSASANQLLMASPPAPGEESPAVVRKRVSAGATTGATVGPKVRNSFGAVIESLKKTPLVVPQDVASSPAVLGKKKKEHVSTPKPAETATVAKASEPNSKASSGRRLSLNMITGPADVPEPAPAPEAAPAVTAAVVRSKRQSLVPGSPSRTSLRIAQKAPLGKTKTTTPQRAAPNAVEVLRAARASLGSPAGTKRVNIALARNEAQEVWEYHAALESSPGIPYDAARRPAESALKPGAVPSPVNPFYRRPKFLS